jgi:salicylate hydroxylase
VSRASNRLSTVTEDKPGAFGSGAAFALEDGWILARAIEHTRYSPNNLQAALEIFDQIRSPYYLRM